MKKKISIILLIVFLLVTTSTAYVSSTIDSNLSKEGIRDDEFQNEGYHDDQFTETFFGDISLSLKTSKSLLPSGGGQATQITAHVTHGEDLPVEGAIIYFFASTRTEERVGQLSVTEAVTNEKGIAVSTYITLMEDNNQHITLTATTEGNDCWINKNTYLIASDEVSWCEGRIINPFTGKAHPNTTIDIFNSDNEYYFCYEDIVDENGFYSIAVPPGDYDLRLYLNLEDEDYYSSSYSGSHSILQPDNIINLRIVLKIDSNKVYTLNTEMGILKGKVSNLDSSNKIYITKRSGNTVIAEVNPDGSFMIALPEGVYEIDARGGHILHQGVRVEKGQITNLGSFSR
jgi:hypothetical protein